MEITNVDSTILCVPYKEPEPWAWGVGHYGVNGIIVEMSTDQGVVGIGEGTSPHASVELGKMTIDATKKFLVGEDPFDIERIMRRIWSAGFTDHRVLSGVEMALWDIVGKACRKPLYKLLGGTVTKKVPFAPWLNRKKPEEMAKQAADFVGQGFDTFYIKLGIEPREDIEAVKAVRDAVGDRCNIRVDANQGWTPGFAVKMIRKLERYDIDFVEDPTNSYGMARVKKAVNTPICSGAETVYEIFRVIREGSADIIGHIDPRMQGGILNCKKASAVCEMAGLPVVAHAGWELSIATSAILHIAASTPNFILPNQTYYMYLTDDVCEDGMFKFDHGCMTVPEEPGLGLKLDRKKVRTYADLYKRQGGFSIYEPSKTQRPSILPHQVY
jgi:L-alanine-DL-glutamate epimerase-like enolase superfamily enzyme